MKTKARKQPEKRTYRQGARAEAAQASAERILQVFAVHMREGWFEEIRLDEIADAAGVSVQTVIRRFGGKEGLLTAAMQQMSDEIVVQRTVPEGDIAAAVRAVLADYEDNGDLVLRMLAQEDRYPVIRQVTDIGRNFHRQWIAGVFKRWLDPLAATQKRIVLDNLVVALDLYVWRLLRRDMKRPQGETIKFMEETVRCVLNRAENFAKEN